MRISAQGLAPDMSEAELRSAFEAYGKVSFVKINIQEGPHGSLPLCSAIIGMPDRMESMAAISGLNGKKLKGKILIVNEAGVGIRQRIEATR